MFRKEIDELQLLKMQVKELAQEIALLKTQIITNSKFTAASNHIGDRNLGKNLGKIIGKAVMDSNSSKDFNIPYKRQAFNQLIHLISSVINNKSELPSSFAQSQQQSCYYQLQSFKNIYYKL